VIITRSVAIFIVEEVRFLGFFLLLLLLLRLVDGTGSRCGGESEGASKCATCAVLPRRKVANVVSLARTKEGVTRGPKVELRCWFEPTLLRGRLRTHNVRFDLRSIVRFGNGAT
jgi:hypothetical protein